MLNKILFLPLLPIVVFADLGYSAAFLQNPTDLSLEASHNSVKLTWRDNSSNETGFKIYRNSILIHIVAANVTTFVDDSVSSNSAYQYKVKATNDAPYRVGNVIRHAASASEYCATIEYVSRPRSSEIDDGYRVVKDTVTQHNDSWERNAGVYPVNYTYNTLGDVTSNGVQNIEYDRYGNIVKDYWSNNRDTYDSYQYDSNANVIKQTSSITDGYYEYKYDSHGSLIVEKYIESDGSVRWNRNYIYDDNQRLKSEVSYGTSGYTKKDYTYDVAGNVIEAVHTSTELIEEDAIFAGEGNVTRSYEYDSNNREIAMHKDDKNFDEDTEYYKDRDVTKEYDIAGRIVKEVIDEVDEEQMIIEYTYHDNGILNERKIDGRVVAKYDSHGNSLGRVYSYEYNALGQVIKYTFNNDGDFHEYVWEKIF